MIQLLRHVVSLLIFSLLQQSSVFVDPLPHPSRPYPLATCVFFLWDVSNLIVMWHERAAIILVATDNSCKIVHGIAMRVWCFSILMEKARVVLAVVLLTYEIGFQRIECDMDFTTVYIVLCSLLFLVS